MRAELRGKGFKGAVGTSASYAQLLARHGRLTPRPSWSSASVMAALGLEAFPVATQTYPRKQDYRVLVGAGRAGRDRSTSSPSTCACLQSPPIGEWAEPFGAGQVGSSAMPFKRNPIHAENMDSLARLLAALPRVAWDNAAHSLLERTLDDSANRRTILPEAFLIADELLHARHAADRRAARRSRRQSRACWPTYGPFAATERLLMELVKAGGDRQELHEVDPRARHGRLGCHPRAASRIRWSTCSATIHASRITQHATTCAPGSTRPATSATRRNAHARFAGMLRQHLQGSARGMKLSLILAHPDPGSFNHAIAETARQTLLRNGHTVFFHDLYAERFDPMSARARNPERRSASS